MALTEKKVTDSKSGFVLQDLREEKFHKVTFQGAEFEGVDMRNTSLAHVNFVQSTWEHTYFANVHLDKIQMGGTVFENIIRPQAEQSALEEEAGTAGWVNVEPVIFKNSDLSTAQFHSCNLSGAELNDCKIDGLKINGIEVQELIEQYLQNVQKADR